MTEALLWVKWRVQWEHTGAKLGFVYALGDPGKASWEKYHLSEYQRMRLARLEYGMRRGFQTEHPACLTGT